MTYTVTGQLREGGIIVELDTPLPVEPGPVILRVLSTAIRLPAAVPDPEKRKRRRMALVGSVSDEDTKEILSIVEHEFEQVNPDDWR